MKNLHVITLLFCALCLFYGCKNDENPQPQQVTIEKAYPFYFEMKSLDDDIDPDTKDLFRNNIVAVNSIQQLENYELLDFYPETTQEELRLCDFERYTLILTSSYSFYEFTDLEHRLTNEISSPEYKYNQNLHCKFREPENVYMIVSSFLIKKIPDNSEILFYYSSITAIEGIDW